MAEWQWLMERSDGVCSRSDSSQRSSDSKHRQLCTLSLSPTQHARGNGALLHNSPESNQALNRQGVTGLRPSTLPGLKASHFPQIIISGVQVLRLTA